jgi:hypothetical protein
MLDLKELQRYVSMATAVIVLLMGIAFISLCIKGLMHAADQDAWPTATAVIEKVNLNKIEQAQEEQVSTWRLQLQYRYELGDQIYQGNRVGNFVAEPSETAAKNRVSAPEVLLALAKEYAIGNAVTIFYNPADPNDSFIRKDKVSAVPWVMAFIGLACFIFASWRIRKLAKSWV